MGISSLSWDARTVNNALDTGLAADLKNIAPGDYVTANALAATNMDAVHAAVTVTGTVGEIEYVLASDATAFDDLGSNAITATGAGLAEAEAFFNNAMGTTAPSTSFASVASFFSLHEITNGSSVDLFQVGLADAQGEPIEVTIAQAKAVLLAENFSSLQSSPFLIKPAKFSLQLRRASYQRWVMCMLRTPASNRLGILSTQDM